MALQLAYWIFLTITCSYALLYGRTAERLGSVIMIVGSVLSVIVTSDWADRFRDAEIGIFLVDLAVLAAFLAIAIRTKRTWPLWVTGFQLVGVTTHIATMVDPAIVHPAYALAQGFWGYPMLIAIAMGARTQRLGARPRRMSAS